MRFLTVYKPSKGEGNPPTQQEMCEMSELVEEGMKAGWLLSTEGCLPSSLGARVRQSTGNVVITDGPFVETKELIGGFALIQAGSKQEAVELTKHFLTVAGDGEVEIRQLYEAPAAASASR